MGIFKKKFLVKLVAVICVFLTLFNLTGATKVYATESESEGWGGVLIKPVMKLLTAIADGITGFLNKNIEGQKTAFIKVEGQSSWWSKWGTMVEGIITGIILTAATVAILISTGGATALGVGTTIKIAVTLFLSSGTAGYLIADVMDGSYFPDDIYLPVFRVSLDRIFSDDIALLDVNFFSADKVYKRKEEKKGEETVYEGNANGLEFMGQSGINVFIQEEDTSKILPVSEIFKKENGNYKYANFVELINQANSNTLVTEDKKISENANLYFKIGTNVEISVYNDNTMDQITTTTYL